MLIAVAVVFLMLSVVLTAFAMLRVLQKIDDVEKNTYMVQGIGIVNGVFIAIMNLVYQKVAHIFTFWENHRTQVKL